MKRMLVLFFALCLLAGCSPAAAESRVFEGKPYPNSNLYGQWPSERPGPEASFDLYANFDFYQEALAKEAADDFTLNKHAANLISEQIEALCRDSGKPGTEEEILRILYALYMDTDKREQECRASLAAHADRLKAAKTLDDLAELIREEGVLYGHAFFNYTLKSPDGGKGKYTILCTVIPVIDDLPVDEVTFEFRGKDTDGARNRLQLMGFSAEDASRMTEQALVYCGYDQSFPAETDRDIELMQKSPLTLNEIREICPPAFDILTAQGLAKEGAGDEPVYEFQSFGDLLRLRSFFREKNLDGIKAVIALGMNAEAEAVLPKNTEGTGHAELMAGFRALVPQAVLDQAYVHNYVSREKIDLYRQLVDEYKEAMRARIEQCSWISEETKKEASRKIDQMVAAEILYPYGEIDCGSLLEGLRSAGNLLEAKGQSAQFGRQCMAHFAGRDWVRGNRFGTTHTSTYEEAQYEPLENAFYIGGGALIDVLADATSRETLLGTLGTHIGHELSHGFDINGSQYNADFTGPLFTEKDLETFKEKSESIARQLSRIEVLDGIYGNGELQIGEVQADLTGMSLTLDLAGKTENFDYDAFFRAYASYFARYYHSREALAYTIGHMNYPMGYIRNNFCVAHFDEFYRTYPSVTEGTPMYIAPEDRLLVW